MSRSITIVPFEPAHYEQMELRKYDMLAVMGFYDLQGVLEIYKTRGEAFTGFMGDWVVACGGIINLWQGVGEAWMLTTGLVREIPVNFHKAVLSEISNLWKKHNLHRMQCTVHSEHEKSIRWVARLGFEREGVLRKYGPDGKDYVMFGKVE